MSKTLFTSLLVLVALFAFAVSAMPSERRNQQQQQPPKLHAAAARKHHRAGGKFTLGRIGTPDGCIDNITLAGEQVATAIVQVFTAIAECPKPNNTAGCIKIISEIAEDLTTAATEISLAVSACGGQGSACATDLFQLSTSLADAARRVSAAVQDCENKEIGQCVEQIMDEIGDIEGIVRGIRNAITECKA